MINMATAGSIVVDLLMRTGSFETDSKRAEQRMKQMSREIDQTIGRFKALAATAIGLGSLGVALKSATSYMSEMGNAAQRTSVSVKVFTELNFAAERASLSQGELERVLRRSTEAINHAIKGGSKQAEALDKLGISAYDAAGNIKTADVMLRDMSEKFSKLEPGARKTGLVIDLFGQQLGQKVIPLLNSGADGLDDMAAKARSLGLVIDEEAAQAAADFEDNLNDLKKASHGLTVTLTSELIPAITSLISQFQIASQTDSIFGWFITSGKEAKNAQETLEGVEESLRKAKATLKTFEEAGKNSSFMKWWNADDVLLLKAQIKGMEQRRDYLKGLVADQGASGGVKEFEPIGVSSDGLGKPNKPKRTTTVVDEGQRLIDQMNERIALLGKETEYEKLLAQVSLGSIKFKVDGQKDLALGLAKTLDMRTSEIEHERTLKELRAQQSVTQKQFMREIEAFGQGDWLRGLNDALARTEDKYQQIIQDRRNSPMGLSDDQLDAIQESLDTELEMVRNHYETMKGLQGDWALGASEALINYVDNSRNIAGQVEDIFTNAFSNIESTVFDFVKTGQLDLRGLLVSIGDDVVKMLVRMGVQMAANAVLGKTLGASATAASAAMGATTAAAWAPAAAFASLASFGGNSAPAMVGISTTVGLAQGLALTGMAHDGIDSVPETGTWLLEKGERVMTANTSARMDALFDRLEPQINMQKETAPKVQPQPPIVNIIENPERAGQVDSRYENEQYILSVFVNSVRSGTQAHEAIVGAYDVRRVGR